ncbi:unnamed protein product, partial [Cyprideis torosa]
MATKEEDEVSQQLEGFGAVLHQCVVKKLAQLIKDKFLKLEDLNEMVAYTIGRKSNRDVIQALESFEKSDMTFVTDMPSYLRGFVKSTKFIEFDLQECAKKVLSGSMEKQLFVDKFVKHFNKRVTITQGQRKIGPLEDTATDRPPTGSDVFLGNLPRHHTELDVLPHLVKFGVVYELRIMWGADTAEGRGYGFVTYQTPSDARQAAAQLNGFRITNQNTLKAALSVPYTRLYVAGIPKSKGRKEVMKELEKSVSYAGLKDVVLYEDVAGSKKTPGFAFLEYSSYDEANLARKVLQSGEVKPFGVHVYVEWAEAQHEPNEEVMDKVKVLFVKFSGKTLNEEQLLTAFKEFGNLDRVKVLNKYAFVYFSQRENALKAMGAMDEEVVGGSKLEVALAKPQAHSKTPPKSEPAIHKAVAWTKGKKWGAGRASPYQPTRPMRPGGIIGNQGPPSVERGYVDGGYYFPPPIPVGGGGPMRRGRGSTMTLSDTEMSSGNGAAVSVSNVAGIVTKLEKLTAERNIDRSILERLAGLVGDQKLSLTDIDEQVINSISLKGLKDVLQALTEFEKADTTYVTDMPSYLRGFVKSVKYIEFDLKQSAEKVLNGSMEAQTFLDLFVQKYGKKILITQGQRKVGPPEEDMALDRPGPGCEVFFGNIPRHFTELELLPYLVKCGMVYELRILWDPELDENKGFGFVTYSNSDEAKAAVAEFHLHKMAADQQHILKVTFSSPNTRLYVAGIPKTKDKEDIRQELTHQQEGLKDVIVYEDVAAGKKNRGFCFLEYRTHSQAAAAKKKIQSGRIRPFAMDTFVEWAEAPYEPGEEVMAKVKVLFVKFKGKLLSEEQMTNAFKSFDNFERVKVLNNYAFVHFTQRANALEAMEKMNGTEVDGSTLIITLAKPPAEDKKTSGPPRASVGTRIPRGGGLATGTANRKARATPYLPMQYVGGYEDDQFYYPPPIPLRGGGGPMRGRGGPRFF